MYFFEGLSFNLLFAISIARTVLPVPAPPSTESAFVPPRDFKTLFCCTVASTILSSTTPSIDLII